MVSENNYHRRTRSDGISLVIDLVQSGAELPIRPPPKPNYTNIVGRKIAARHILMTHNDAHLRPDSITMSLVSPPFTPSASELELPIDTPQHSPRSSVQSQQTASDTDFISTDIISAEPALRTTTSFHPSSAPRVKPTAEQFAVREQQVRRQLDNTLPVVFCESRARIPTTTGEEIFLHVYSNNVDSKEHLAIVFGQSIHSKTLFAPRPNETEHDRMTRGAYTGKLYPGRTNSHPDPEHPQSYDVVPGNAHDVLCRIHSECYTGETAWSARCDCGEQLDEAARLMSEEGRGCIVYLRQEGRGIGLGEKLKAYNLQDLGADTVQANIMLRHPADGRTFGLATAILLDLGLDHIRLMTNNPDKIVAVEGKNKEIEVTQRVPMIPLSWQKNGGFQSDEVDKYLATKIERMGHLLQR